MSNRLKMRKMSSSDEEYIRQCVESARLSLRIKVEILAMYTEEAVAALGALGWLGAEVARQVADAGAFLPVEVLDLFGMARPIDALRQHYPIVWTAAGVAAFLGQAVIVTKWYRAKARWMAVPISVAACVVVHFL